MSEKTEEETSPISLITTLSEELNYIRPAASGEKTSGEKQSGEQIPDEKKPEELNGVFIRLHNAKLSALCFSGGGIRSATFGLGIIQALAKHSLLDKFDYLSTVSGGGYLGAWLSAWIRREQMKAFENELEEKQAKLEVEDGKTDESKEKIKVLNEEIANSNRKIFNKYNALSEKDEAVSGKKIPKPREVGILEVQRKLNDHTIPKAEPGLPPSPNPEPKQLQFLREYSNYMSPKVGLLSADTWTLVGIYTRNLFLNWTIFIPLICAILLIPKILLEIVNYKTGETGLSLMILLGLLAGIFAVIFTVGKLPSKNTGGNQIRFNTDAGIFLTVILPLIVMAFFVTTFWAWYCISSKKPGISLDFIHRVLPGWLFSILPDWLFLIMKYEFVNFIIFSVLIFVLGNIAYFIIEKIRSEKIKFKFWEIVSAAASSLIGGSLTWLIAHNFFDVEYFSNPSENPFYLRLYLCLAVPLYLLCFSVGSTIFVGIYSRVATDDDREWLARQGAWILIVSGAWIVLNLLVLFGPIGLDYLITGTFVWKEFFNTIISLIAAISGFLSLAGGYSGKSQVRQDQPNKTRLSKFLAVAPKIAAPIFLAFIFVCLAYISQKLLIVAGEFIETFLKTYTDWTSIINIFNVSPNPRLAYLLLCFIVLAVLGLVMACFINVNKFSLHAAYRDRLIRAYLGASRTRRKGNTFTGFDDRDNFQLHRLKGQKPFHIINATLNLVSGKNLAWQDRKAASFTMSPLHCGSWLLGYRNTNKYCRNENLPNCEHLRFCNKTDKPCVSVDACELKGKALRLGTAMTISGAAANPNMGYYSSPVVTFLMTLFNIRLGWWLGNTGKAGDTKDWFGWFGDTKFFTKPSPSIAILPLLNETLGRTDEDKHFLNVTDGGHFENLGLYEMVLRRCRLIILSDAAADEKFTFGEISNAIEKCKVDLGVDIKFTDDIKIYSRLFAKENKENEKITPQRFAIAEIIYPETIELGKHYKGYLIYLRPTYYGDEATDIKHYANLNESFPHQATIDEFYDEKQFEAYRNLGFFMMEKVIKEATSENLTELLKRLRETKI